MKTLLQFFIIILVVVALPTWWFEMRSRNNEVIAHKPWFTTNELGMVFKRTFETNDDGVDVWNSERWYEPFKPGQYLVTPLTNAKPISPLNEEQLAREQAIATQDVVATNSIEIVDEWLKSNGKKPLPTQKAIDEWGDKTLTAIRKNAVEKYKSTNEITFELGYAPQTNETFHYWTNCADLPDDTHGLRYVHWIPPTKSIIEMLTNAAPEIFTNKIETNFPSIRIPMIINTHWSISYAW